MPPAANRLIGRGFSGRCQRFSFHPRGESGMSSLKQVITIAAALTVLAGACGAAPASAANPTDPQIAHIAYTAGQIDIAAAQQALKKSQSAKVRAFAQDMVRDHTSVNEQALALCKKLGVTPEDNETSKTLQKNA